MAKKLKIGAGRKKAAETTAEGGIAQAIAEGNLAKAVRDSAQEIWLAGLGAYSRAKDEGSGAFETLVKMGQELQAKSMAVADSTREALASRAAGTWGKVEQVFEERVSRSLSALGVPSGKEFIDLSERIKALNDSVQKLVDEQRKSVATAATAARRRAKQAVADAESAAKPVVARARKVVEQAVEMAGAMGGAAPAAKAKPARAKPAGAKPAAAKPAGATRAPARRRSAKATGEAAKAAGEDANKD